MEKDVKTQWHPAFCSALKLELREDAQYLTYTNEYNINSKPLQMDMLIVKKPKDIKIKNQLGKIFRGHNIIEYKSPEDTMNLNTFIKVKGYAYIYKANELHVGDIGLDDITISLIRAATPKKLLAWFLEKGYEVIEKYRGIFYILKENEFPVQVIVSKRLSKEHQKWLTLLNGGLKKDDVKRAVLQTNALTQKDEKDQADSVLQVIFKENGSVFQLVKEDETMCEALRELMAKEIQEELQIAQEKAKIEGKNEGALEAMFQLVKKNLISVETASNEVGLSVEDFINRMNNYETSKQ